jgi:hypothetical protein
VVTLDGARDNWFGRRPPPSLAGERGDVLTEGAGRQDTASGPAKLGRVPMWAAAIRRSIDL